jgi:hypothetical protein
MGVIKRKNLIIIRIITEEYKSLILYPASTSLSGTASLIIFDS